MKPANAEMLHFNDVKCSEHVLATQAGPLLRRAARLLRKVGEEPRFISAEMEEALDGVLPHPPEHVSKRTVSICHLREFEGIERMDMIQVGTLKMSKYSRCAL